MSFAEAIITILNTNKPTPHTNKHNLQLQPLFSVSPPSSSVVATTKHSGRPPTKPTHPTNQPTHPPNLTWCGGTHPAPAAPPPTAPRGASAARSGTTAPWRSGRRAAPAAGSRWRPSAGALKSRRPACCAFGVGGWGLGVGGLRLGWERVVADGLRVSQ